MVKFVSKSSNQVLCMVPNRVQIVDGMAVPIPGKRVTFENGEYNTTDKKEIEFLRSHRLFGVAIAEVEQLKPAEQKEPPKK